MAKEQNIQDLIVSNPQIKNSILKLESVKTQLDTLSDNCLKIKVVDDASLSVMEHNLSKLSSLVKAVEETRKTEKQPYLDACNAIDSVHKYITKQSNEAIKYLKSEKENWVKKIEELKRKKEEAKSKHEQLKQFLYDKLSLASKSEHCQALLDKIKSIKETMPEKGKDVYLDYYDNALLLIREYETSTFDKLGQLTVLENLDKNSDAAKQIEENINKLQEEIKQSADSAAVIVEPVETKINKIRKTWDFELVDIKKVPIQWLTIDENKVKEYLSISKDILKDGEVINGVKFFQKTGISA